MAPDGENVYVTADVDNSVTTFSRDTGTGALTWEETVKDGDPGVAGLQFATGVAVSPDNNDVYVTGCGDSAVTVFDRTGANGELTFNEMEQQGVAGVDGIGCARGVAVAPNGSTVSVVGESSDAVATFTRTPATGAIAYLGMVKDGVGGVDGLDGARDLAYTADSAGLYVASLVDDSVATFTANPGTGALTFVESDRDGVGGVQGLDGANGVAVPVDGKHVYVTGETDDAVATFVRTLVDPQPPAAAERHFTFTVKKKTVVKGKKAKFKGALVSSTAACKAGQVVQLSKSTKGAAYKPAGTVTTAADGSFKVRFKVRKKTRFRASVVATSACIAAQSPPRTVKVTEATRLSRRQGMDPGPGGLPPHVTATPAISRADVGLRSERGPILLAVMLSVGLVAIDATILATAVPAVVGDLGGFTQFPWLFSVYLLTQAVSVPLYSKLADQYGRKPMMLVGVGLFLVGSLLCGLAWSMTSLIAFRAVQGLGAGAVQPIGMTIVGDIYSIEERAKVQGYLAGVWALASVVGPTLGGVFSDYASWRWIFFVNLPIGAAALWMFVRKFEERVTKAPHKIDVLGSLLLSGGGVLLLLGLLEGGVRWDWASPTSIALFATSVLLLARLRVRRDAGRRTGAAAVGLPAPRDPPRAPHLARRRRAADRADVVRPALRAGGPGARRRDGRASRWPRSPWAGRCRRRTPDGSTSRSGSGPRWCSARPSGWPVRC